MFSNGWNKVVYNNRRTVGRRESERLSDIECQKSQSEVNKKVPSLEEASSKNENDTATNNKRVDTSPSPEP